MTKFSPLFLFSLIFSSFLIILSESANAELCNPIDKNALLQIKNELGPTSTFFSSWRSDTDCCHSWLNVGCNNRTNRVNYLTIGHNNELSGQIPKAVGDLTGLEVLYFNDLPGLTGPIPSIISNLINVNELEFFRTNLTGSIPASLSRLTKLETLDLSENRLSGSIPPSLSLLSKLQSLNLAQNQLSGSIPESFGSFKRLTFNAQDNRLSGPIPRSLGSTGFNWVNITNNRLTGDASFLFGKDKKVVLLDLKNNALSFDLSKVEFPLKLRGLDLSHNLIYGSIPKPITKLKLELFDVSFNRLCGPIPAGSWLHEFGPLAFSHNHCLCGAPLSPCK